MGQVEKTVFISYRRTNMPWALAIFQNLKSHGYDVFFDFESIPSGDFSQVIVNNIKARAHFLVILTPSALERCDNPNDWLRREIETALDEKRNIVPVFLEGFSFGDESISKHLTGKLANLKNYNGQNVPAGFFEEAMQKIREKFLNVSLDAVLHPVPVKVQKEVRKQQEAASHEAKVEPKELEAQEFFEKAAQNPASEVAVAAYTESARLNPKFAETYFNRAAAYKELGNYSSAIDDYQKYLELTNGLFKRSDPKRKDAEFMIQSLQSKMLKQAFSPKKQNP